MVESPIPQDILKYKTKFVSNFSLRETIFLALGGIAGATAFFTFLSSFSLRPRILLTALCATPFFVFGFFKIVEQPLEKVLVEIIIDNFLTPLKICKEIHHPELEKYEKSRLFETPSKEDGKKKKKKPGIKVKSSKNFKSIK